MYFDQLILSIAFAIVSSAVICLFIDIRWQSCCCATAVMTTKKVALFDK